MADVEFPALIGTDPLGFLASLGVLRIIAERADPDARLRFDPLTACARLRSILSDTASVGACLRDEVARVADGGVVPGATASFPKRKSGSGADPMRVPRASYRPLVDRLNAHDADAVETWMPALLTDLAVEGKDERAALTPYTAPSGQQSLWTFFEKSLGFVSKRPEYLDEALTGWRRVGDTPDTAFSGEYFDHRVIRSAADHPSGESTEAGVPGATWLAIMALPVLRVSGDGASVMATCWHRLDRRTSLMVWPVWREPLDVPAVIALLEDPSWRPTRGPERYGVRVPAAASYGVFAIGGARRQRIEGRNFAGVLVPVRIELDVS